MKFLILNQIHLCLKRKNIFLLVIVLICVQIIQLYEITNIAALGRVTVSRTDYILKVSGGVQLPFSIFGYLYWAFLVITLLLITQTCTTVMEGFDAMQITRAKTRIKWWVSKVISLVLITTMYSMVLILIPKLMAAQFLQDFSEWSGYAQNYYPELCKREIKSNEIVNISYANLIFGFMALTTMFQTVNMLFNNNVKIYVISVVIVLISGVMYMSGSIPRVFSPIHFASTIDLIEDLNNYKEYLVFNILIIICSIIIGCIGIRKKDYHAS